MMAETLPLKRKDYHTTLSLQPTTRFVKVLVGHPLRRIEGHGSNCMIHTFRQEKTIVAISDQAVAEMLTTKYAPHLHGIESISLKQSTSKWSNRNAVDAVDLK